MAPVPIADLPVDSHTKLDFTSPRIKQPLKLSGALEGFEYDDVTPVIGREFTGVNIVDDLLNASNSDELLRDLAITSKPILRNESL